MGGNLDHTPDLNAVSASAMAKLTSSVEADFTVESISPVDGSLTKNLKGWSKNASSVYSTYSSPLKFGK